MINYKGLIKYLWFSLLIITNVVNGQFTDPNCIRLVRKRLIIYTSDSDNCNNLCVGAETGTWSQCLRHQYAPCFWSQSHCIYRTDHFGMEDMCEKCVKAIWKETVPYGGTTEFSLMYEGRVVGDINCHPFRCICSWAETYQYISRHDELKKLKKLGLDIKDIEPSSSSSYSCKCGSTWCNKNCYNHLHDKKWYSAKKGIAIPDKDLKNNYCKKDDCREAFDDCRHSRETQKKYWRKCKDHIKADFLKKYGENFSINDDKVYKK
ncbi:hypothetical protein BCR32DRAFT_283463 [Anaeromyces robustus]|uniref:Apple domain-containing protein n=1 Tax=Anaeromyces robustus TaxID=1754192 RepID=A0A1Y1WVM4_9FUNG|nr:hypothetical protein BCR32DRAFT_283463 [Anaeromyces robustus]|eukprot:ORX77174.1 hypothetical protein BCR32DRAFT_283463 [Anaeromyces robustus]